MIGVNFLSWQVKCFFQMHKTCEMYALITRTGKVHLVQRMGSPHIDIGPCGTIVNKCLSDLMILAMHGAKTYPWYILLDYFTTRASFKNLNRH